MVEEVEWLESSTGVTISITMRGAKLTTVDIVHTDTYIKVVFNYISISMQGTRLSTLDIVHTDTYIKVFFTYISISMRGLSYPPWISSKLIHTSKYSLITFSWAPKNSFFLPLNTVRTSIYRDSVTRFCLFCFSGARRWI